MTRLAELISKYKTQSPDWSERDKAKAEVEIWNTFMVLNPTHSAAHGRREYLKDILGGPVALFEHRSILYHSGDAAIPLWEMWDSGVSSYTVTRLHRVAKSMAMREGRELSSVIRQVVDNYHSSGHESVSPSGKKFKVNSIPTITIEPFEGPFEPSPEPIVEPAQEYEFDSSTAQIVRSKKFNQDLNSLVDSYVQSSLLESIDEHAIHIIKQSFLHFIQEAAEDFKRKLSQIRSDAKKEKKRIRVTRDEFRRACEVLNLRYTYGSPVDLKVCKRTMLQRAAPLHPDRNNGSHERLIEYQAVISSYNVLEEYSEGLRIKNGDHDNESR